MKKIFIMALSTVKRRACPLAMIFILLMLFSCTKYNDPVPFFEEYGQELGPEKQRKVLIVSIDGVLGSEIEKAVPVTIAKLIKTSKYTWRMESEDQSNNAATWASMMTGVSADKHRIHDDTFRTKPDSDDTHVIPDYYPSLFHRLMETQPEYNTVVISPIHNLANTLLMEAETRIVPEDDAGVRNAAIAQLESEDPEVMVVNFRSVLQAGALSGFSIENPAYLSAINTVDAYLGELIETLENRSSYDQEQWLLIITSNHGHAGDSLKENSLEDRNTFALFQYKSFLPFQMDAARDEEQTEIVIRNVDVFSQLFYWLNIDQEDSWGIDGSIFLNQHEIEFIK